MNADITLLLTSIAETFVVFFHGTGKPVAFAISIVIQSMWAIWGYQIKDWVFVASGLGLATLNGWFHFRKTYPEGSIDSLFFPNALELKKEGKTVFKFKPKVIDNTYRF